MLQLLMLLVLMLMLVLVLEEYLGTWHSGQEMNQWVWATPSLCLH